MPSNLTPREALDRIAARIDRIPDSDSVLVEKDAVRAVLAEVSPEPGGVLDRDQARKVLAVAVARMFAAPEPPTDYEAADALLDALAGCVRPAAIDRDALIGLLPHFDWCDGGELRDEPPFGDCYADRAGLADRILTLVRPVAGVTLTPEDVPLVIEGLRLLDFAREGEPRAEALAARLEAGAAS